MFQRVFIEQKKIALIAFLLALLFSVHPFRVESVAWATERKDVMFALFFLLGWRCYFIFLRTRKYQWMMLGAIFYLMAGLSKSMGITLVGVLFLTDFWMQVRLSWRSIMQKFPFFLALGVLIILFGFIRPLRLEIKPPANKAESLEQYRKASSNEQIASISYIKDKPLVLQKLLSVSMRTVLWIGRSLVPYPLSIAYPHNKYYGMLGQGIFLTPVLLLLICVFFWKERERYPSLIVGFAFFWMTLIPVLIITESGQAIFLSDRYMYIPSMGLFFMVLGLPLISKPISRWIIPGLFLIAGIFTLLSMVNVRHWKNSGTLFRQALRVYPESGMASLNLGLYYSGRKEYDQALSVYSKAISMNTSYVQIYHNRARIYLERGEAALAMNDLKRCVELYPSLPYVWISMARAHQMQSLPESALSDLNKAFVLDSSSREVFCLKAEILYQMKEYGNSILNGERCLLKRPSDPHILNLIGLDHLFLGNYKQAVEYFGRAVALLPKEGGLFFNRSQAHKKAGNDLFNRNDLDSARLLGYKQDTLFLTLKPTNGF
jgi:Tfp pilus assembly protein PilF